MVRKMVYFHFDPGNLIIFTINKYSFELLYIDSVLNVFENVSTDAMSLISTTQ